MNDHARPNIVLILIDDMGWRDLSCQGSTFYETPNIDTLSADGMRFSDAYASCPVCSPTRASILTGRYPASLGVTDWIDWGHAVHPARGRLIDAPYIDHLPASVPNAAQLLGAAGYQTWHVGKWHLGVEQYYPDRVGFDVNIGGWHAGSPYNGYFSPYRFPTLVDGPEGEYLTDRLGSEAEQLIRSRDRSRPFFLNLWFYSVHTPIQAKDELIAKYRAKAKEMSLDTQEAFQEGGFFPAEHKRGKRIVRRVIQSDPVYAAMIESLDQNVGRVLRALADEGEAEDTLVIFTSDNGGLATAEGSPTSNLPLSEGKGWMYEGGTREPFLARWPGVVAAGTTCETPISSVDLLPTFAEAAGADTPADVEGLSMLPLLRRGLTSPNASASPAAFDRPLFWHYPHYGNQGGTPGSSVRHGPYKLIHFYEDDHVELYDLAHDAGETTNLAGKLPEVRDRLYAALDEWRLRVAARIPEPNPDFRPWPEREPPGHGAPVLDPYE